jgi:REP element-mobilizing transposase RayT
MLLISLMISSEKSIDALMKSGYLSYMEAESKPGRPRKRHVQQLLFRHGGKRKGAGRKPKGLRAGARHDRRPEIDEASVLHVVLRVTPEVGNLRRPALYRALRDASLTAAMRERIRIVHISVQRTHVHMLVEAEDKEKLGRGMQGFQISAARNINTALGDKYGRRRGKVFVDRYHLVVITSPTQARNVLSYVLNNWRKHAEDRHEPRTRMVDPCSSGWSFGGWQELAGEAFLWKRPEGYEPMIVYQPRAWMLREGWKRAAGGGVISARAVPSRRPA